jgi:SAM-dependent methyltransferase
VSRGLHRHFYPDNRRDGTIQFYERLREDLRARPVVLNLGAGPGDAPGSAWFAIRDLRAPGRTIHGCDPDPDVLRNVQLDERRVMEGGRIPYGDGFFDAVYSDYVFEHVEDTQFFLREIRRVLKPGGVLHFRTPNTFHYVGIAARALPHRIHTLVANRARRLAADAHDPYPTFYRLNTSRAIRKQFGEAGFQSIELTMVETEPFYLVFNTIAFLGGVAYERLVNRFEALRWLRANIFGRAIR